MTGFVRPGSPAEGSSGLFGGYEEIPLDLSRPGEVKHFLKERLGRCRPPWLAIHNASLLPSRGPVWDETVAQREAAFLVNLGVPLLMATELIPFQLRQNAGGGHLFISSGVGRSVRQGWGSYGMTKQAIEVSSKVIASDLPEPFFSVTMNPGGMRTPMRAFAYPEEDPASLPDPVVVAERISGLVDLALRHGGRFLNGLALDVFDIDRFMTPGGL